jgi:cytochrome d ubiquinol oxidase subunit I
MQNPVGAHFVPGTDRAEMTSLLAVLLNPVGLVTIPHVLVTAYMTAGGLILGVAGWHLAKIGKPGTEQQKKDASAYRWATKFGAWILLGAGVLSVVTGDIQGKIMTDVQPMKMAAAEALWNTEQPASFSLFTLGTPDGKSEVWSLKVPGVLSFLATGDFNGKVYGINDLVKKMESEAFTNSNVQLQKESAERLAKLGVDDWVPNIPITYWTFRLMMGLGFLSILIALYVLYVTRKEGLPKAGKLWTSLMFAAPLSSLFGISFGWIFTEMGRQPFIVFGVLPTASAASPGVSAFEVGLSMVLYTVIYGALAVVEVGLLMHYIKLGLPDVTEPRVLTDDDAPLSFAY